MSNFEGVTEDDVVHVREWVLQRRTRTQNLLDIVDVKDPKYQQLVEDAEIVDLLLDMLDIVLASDAVVTALGMEEEQYG